MSRRHAGQTFVIPRGFTIAVRVDEAVRDGRVKPVSWYCLKRFGVDSHRAPR